jgi:DNA-binding MarR family transcriptional regulator
MATERKSSRFTNSGAQPRSFGPPLIGALLRLPWQAVQRHMLERLHAAGFDDLDPAHLVVFGYPGPQGARPTELAARLGISKQALNHLLGALERRGYVERRADDGDLRARRVELTGRGTSAVHVIRDAVEELERAWARKLGPERFAQLRTILLELNELT